MPHSKGTLNSEEFAPQYSFENDENSLEKVDVSKPAQTSNLVSFAGSAAFQSSSTKVSSTKSLKVLQNHDDVNLLPRNAKSRSSKKASRKSIRKQKNLLTSHTAGSSCKSAMLPAVVFEKIAHDKNKTSICYFCNPEKRISRRRISRWMKGEEFPVYEKAEDNPDYNKIPFDPLTHPQLYKTK